MRAFPLVSIDFTRYQNATGIGKDKQVERNILWEEFTKRITLT